ncbi:MAG: hypothetical protein V1790_18140 [Planctomycetota bacterium]
MNITLVRALLSVLGVGSVDEARIDGNLWSSRRRSRASARLEPSSRRSVLAQAEYIGGGPCSKRLSRLHWKPVF